MKHIHSLDFHTWLLAIIIFIILNNGESLLSEQEHFIYGEQITHGDEQVHNDPKTAELFPTGSGSNLPDCSHACGPCFPCRRVMIGYKCSMTESCPVIYRCFCKGRYYHVPTS